MKVHQLFGFLGDTTMPSLFIDNQQKVLEFCKRNNYDYKLWTPNDVISLMDEYSDYKDMYESVRYDIMKVDIIRFIILHKHGGVYLDLDISPQIDMFRNYDFASSTKYIENPKGKRKIYEIEVLQSEINNPAIIQYLDYVKSQIERNNNIEIYKKWKGRYIMNSTGPFCFTRFIKKNKINIDEYKTNHCFIDVKKKDGAVYNITGDEDFISAPSASWYAKIIGK